MGDFWGLENNQNIKKDCLSCPSLILVNTFRGSTFFDRIKNHLYIEERSLEEAYRGNLCFRRHVPLSKWRQKFFEEFSKNGYSAKARDMLHTHENIKSIVKKMLGKNLTKFLLKVMKR